MGEKSKKKRLSKGGKAMLSYLDGILDDPEAVTFHSIEPVVPATCGECKSMAVSGLLTLCADREAESWFRVVEQCAPPSTCPKRPRTETPLPTSGGGDRWGKLMEMVSQEESDAC